MSIRLAQRSHASGVACTKKRSTSMSMKCISISRAQTLSLQKTRRTSKKEAILSKQESSKGNWHTMRDRQALRGTMQ